MQLWDCDIRGADHLAWAGLGTAGLVFGALLHFCLKVHNLSFSKDVF